MSLTMLCYSFNKTDNEIDNFSCDWLCQEFLHNNTYLRWMWGILLVINLSCTGDEHYMSSRNRTNFKTHFRWPILLRFLYKKNKRKRRALTARQKKKEEKKEENIDFFLSKTALFCGNIHTLHIKYPIYRYLHNSFKMCRKC